MMEPYALTLKAEYAMSVISLDAATIQRLTADPEHLLELRMSGEHADCALLSSVVREIAARLRRLSEPMRRRMEANLLDILGTVLSPRSADGALSPEQRLAQIKLYIRSHLHDRCLTTAAMPGCSLSVHAIFIRCSSASPRRSGATFAICVWTPAVECCLTRTHARAH